MGVLRPTRHPYGHLETIDVADAVHSGFVFIPDFLTAEETRSLLPSHPIMDRRWIQADPKAGRRVTIWRNHLEPITLLTKPNVFDAITNVRKQVNRAGREIGDSTLALWGTTEVFKNNDEWYVQALGLRYYELLDGYGVQAHRDPERSLGLQFTIVLSGSREYTAKQVDRDGNVVRVQTCTLNPGGVFLQLESQDDRFAETQWKFSRPEHSVGEATAETAGVVGVLTYSRWPLHLALMKAAHLGRQAIGLTEHGFDNARYRELRARKGSAGKSAGIERLI